MGRLLDKNLKTRYLLNPEMKALSDDFGSLLYEGYLQGYGVGNGWKGLIREFLKDFRELKKQLTYDWVVIDIKEKFGTLRIHFSIETNLIEVDNAKYKLDLHFCRMLADEYEKRAIEICENCGCSETTYNLIRNRYQLDWKQTLCDKCYGKTIREKGISFFNRLEILKLESMGWEASLRGMRNPFESWELSDTTIINGKSFNDLVIGKNDLKLALSLVKAGPSHRKFLRFLHIQLDIVACLKWWDQFDTYLHTVKNSTSQMHKLGSKILTYNDFSDIDEESLTLINYSVKKYQENKNADNRRIMIDKIPQSFLYRRTVDFSYEVFLTMYPNRKKHKMNEWEDICESLRYQLPYMNTFLLTLEN